MWLSTRIFSSLVNPLARPLFVFVATFSPTFFIAAPTFASTDLREHGEAAYLKEVRAYRASLIDVQGKLECVAGTEAASCLMSIQDPVSGKSYELTHSKGARELYKSGKREVKVSGILIGEGGAIRVREVEAVN